MPEDESKGRPRLFKTTCNARNNGMIMECAVELGSNRSEWQSGQINQDGMVFNTIYKCLSEYLCIVNECEQTTLRGCVMLR